MRNTGLNSNSLFKEIIGYDVRAIFCEKPLSGSVNESKLMVSLAKEKNIGIIAKRPIANVPWRFDQQPFGDYCEEYWKRMKKMNLMLDIDWLEAAIRFSAYTEGVASIIIGTSSIDHLEKNIKFLEKGKLPNKIYSLIRKTFQNNDSNWVGQI